MRSIFLLAALPVFIVPSNGDVIRPVSGSTSDLIGFGSIANVIDGNIDFDSFLQLGPNGAGSFQGPFNVRFDLGGEYNLNAMTLWNNAGNIENDGEGIRSFSLTFRDSSAIAVGSFAADASDILAPQTFNFNAAGVAFVDLRILSNQRADLSYVDFHEINFTGQVPEPTTTALLISAALLLFRKPRG